MSDNYQERKAKLARARQALLARQRKAAGGAAVQNVIPRRAAADPLPLGVAQQRFWFLHLLDPHNPAYNMHQAWIVDGPLDVEALQRSLTRVTERQAALRHAIGLIDDVPHLVTALPAETPLPIQDLTHLAGDALWDAARQAAIAEARTLFDLFKGPLVRFSLLKIGPARHVFLFTVHHIIADEHSLELFWNDLAYFYGLEMGSPPGAPLPDLPIQYGDYVAWQASRPDEANGRDLAYWKKQLAGDAPLLQLPTNFPRPATQTYDGGFARRTLPANLIQPIRELSRSVGATPFMTVMALFQTMLHAYGREDEIWVGTPVANRPRPEVEKLFGLFLNTVVLRTDFAALADGGESPRFIDLLDGLRQTTLDAFSHQELPFEKVVDELHPRRDPGHNPLFQVMLVYGDTVAQSNERLPGLTFNALPVDGGVSKFDLTLFVTLAPQGVELGLEYRSDLFKPETAERILSHFETLLNGILANPEQRLAQLSLLAEDERRLILEAWQAGSGQPAPAKPLDQLIFERAESYPEREAIVAHDGR
ncbi:MAG: condensation domain-containing protein, partial [Chloroflexota bacterium]